MTIRSVKDRIRTLVVDTVSLLCKNGLPNGAGFSIDGTIGVSSLSDEDDVFLISIKEVVKNELEKMSTDSDSDATNNSHSSHHKRKRKRRASKDSESRAAATPEPVSARVKIENNSDSDSEDLVMVKEEPSPAHQRQLQATPLNASESAAINEAVHNSISSLAQIQSYQPLAHSWQPQHIPGMPSLPIPQHHQQQQQQHQQQQNQHMVQRKQQSTPQMQGFGHQASEECSSKYTVEDMKTIAHRVATTEGMFLTVRLVKRRVSRFPTDFIIRTMRDFMSRHPSDPLFLGYYKEPPRTKVFYKCPPDIIRQEALDFLGCSREIYTEMFNNVPKVQKWDKPEIQGRLLLSVLESSPFIHHYDKSILHMHAKQKGPVAKMTSETALDLSVDSPSVQQTPMKDETDMEDGEIPQPAHITDSPHSTLAPLYAMADKLSRRGAVLETLLGGGPPPPQGENNHHSNCDSAKDEHERGGTPSAQQFAEKAIMKTMYHNDGQDTVTDE